MERFIHLFADFLSLVYHCFDRIVVHRISERAVAAEQVVYSFAMLSAFPW